MRSSPPSPIGVGSEAAQKSQPARLSPRPRARIDASLALDKSVDVTGTPTLYINGRKVGSLDPHMSDVYKNLVEFASEAKESKNDTPASATTPN